MGSMAVSKNVRVRLPSDHIEASTVRTYVDCMLGKERCHRFSESAVTG